MKGRFTYLLIIAATALACENSKPDISGIDLNVEIQRLDSEIFTEPAEKLSAKYGVFFDYYTRDILGVGKCCDSLFDRYFNFFKNSDVVKIAHNAVARVYPSLDDLNRQFSQAFRYYRYYFPDKAVPQIYSYIAGFNQSLILTDSVIGVGLDKYLGANDTLYDALSISKYLSRNMHRDKIVPDCVVNWIENEWEFDESQYNDLISKMLHKGRALYAGKMMLPALPDSLIFGFTAEQLRWCSNNEAKMWVHLIENKLLFSTEYFVIRKLTEDAPFTSEFTPESPGKACNWLGYKIIDKYMKTNPQTLAELMNNSDYRKIMELSRYKPK